MNRAEKIREEICIKNGVPFLLSKYNKNQAGKNNLGTILYECMREIARQAWDDGENTFREWWDQKMPNDISINEGNGDIEVMK